MVYILRRVSHGLVLLFLLSILTFLLAELTPGDALSDLRLDPNISPETINLLQVRYGLDRPLVERYGLWLGSVVRGEFGYSLHYETPVWPLLRPRLRNTLFLMTTATALAWLLALPLGLHAADRPGGLLDRVTLTLAAGIQSMPEILLALGALLLATRSDLFPVGGMASMEFSSLDSWAPLRDFLWHLILPAVVLTLGLLPFLVHHIRSALALTLNQPFLFTARAFGIPRRRRLWRHALPAAAHPLLSLFGLTLARLVSSSLLVEVILGWPGLGPLLLGAVLTRDLHVVLATTLISGVFLLLGNLAADLLLHAVDPRLDEATSPRPRVVPQ
jgi:peptide/nickel transport system permease protein